EPLSDEERKLIEQAPGEDFVESTGSPSTVSEKGYTPEEHTMARPTFEINGIYGGYQGEGRKTIILSSATAKITCRLVPAQEPDKIQPLLNDQVKKLGPTGVTVEVKKEKPSSKAYKVEPNHPLIKNAADSYTKAFEKETVYVRMGGSIPVVEWVDEIYIIPIVLLGFGTSEERLNSRNERVRLVSYDRWMYTVVYLWISVTE